VQEGEHTVNRRVSFLAASLTVVVAVSAVLVVGLPAARGDYIAEVKEGGTRGYLYIGERAIKRQGLRGWMAGDVVIRDDKKVLYFIGRERERRPEARQNIDVDAELREIREELEAWDLPPDGPLPLQLMNVAPVYETRKVSYGAVEARHAVIRERMMADREVTLSHTTDALVDAGGRRAMLWNVAIVDIYFDGQPTWTNTGESAVIAGRECTKYQVRLAPVFFMEVWMTTELGPEYGAGDMFAKAYLHRDGGVRPMEVLREIPGFPLKFEARYRHITGRGVTRIDYEVLQLIETDLDENEFEPRPGSKVYTGGVPGLEGPRGRR